MFRFSKKHLLAGIAAFGVVGSATAISVSTQLAPAARQSIESKRVMTKGETKKTIIPFRANFSGLLQSSNTPQQEVSPLASSKADASLPVIYGSMIYSDDWYNLSGASYPVGYYSFQPTANISFSPIAIHPNLEINGGGCYSDHKLHYHLWEMYADDNSITGITFNDYYCVVNTDNWSFAQTPKQNSETDAYICYDMTYDPVGKQIYGLQWGPYEDTYCNLARIDGVTGESVDVARLPIMRILASNNYGQLFGVDSKNNITYYIDKTTGDLIPLGNSGIVTAYMQSATVDPQTNTIYWAATLADDTSALYTLDTTTGAAVKVAALPGNAELTGLFIEAETKGLNAPAELGDFRLTSNGSNATVAFTVPAKAFDGSTLSGNLTVYVYVDGNLAFSKTATPGENVAGTFSVSDGEHTIVAYASNSVGDGVKTYRIQRTGKDVPAAPSNIVLEVNGGKASLSWTAPVQGLHGGEFDPSTLTYTIVRYPGAQTVAMSYKDTSFSETLPSGTATYYYEVTSYAEGEQGGTGRSNTVFVGSAFNVPYSQDFDDPNSLDGFTIINNEEGRGWYRWENVPQNFKAMASKFNMQTQSDNWLILPTLTLEAGIEYHLTFRQKVFSSDDPEKFEVTIGSTATAEAQTRKLMQVVTVANENWIDYNLPFTVDAAGNYNIAFHCVSPAMSYYLIIDDIAVTDTDDFIDTPLAVTDFKATVDNDTDVVTVSWTAPTQGVTGAALKPELLSYEIYDSYGYLLYSNYTGTSFTDDRFAGEDRQAFVYYQVTPIHGEKVGEYALCDFVVVGPDYPVPFKESFTSSSLDNTPWSLSTLYGNVTGMWTITSSSNNPTVEPVDGDGGMTVFQSYNLTSGSKARLTSPKIDLLTPAHPVLSFYVYKTGSDCRESLVVEISHNDFNFETLGTVKLNDATGWQRVDMEIPRKHCKESSMISFTATSGYGRNIAIDLITVTDGEPTIQGIDLQAVDIELPESWMPGEEKPVKITVYNNGTQTVANYTVSLLADGQTAMSTQSSEAIEPGQTYIYTFKATADEEDYLKTYSFQGKVSCQGDINPENDVTEAKTITIGTGSVGSIENDGITVSISGSVLIICGADGLAADVYAVDGKHVAALICDNRTEVALSHGVYVLKIGNRVEKIVI